MRSQDVEVGVSENQDGAGTRVAPGELVDDDPTSPSGQRPAHSLRPASPQASALGAEHSDPSDPMIGRMMAGRYLVQQRIGRGGMGLVYRARQVGLERDVVIKVLAAEALDTTTAHERFMREAQALSMLNHPNIVSIYDFGQDTQQSYIVMEYVDGTRLDTLIKRHKHLTLDVFTPIARQMLEALGDAHEMGLMHRDLKPSNVLLTHKREYPYYVKVLDFGLAKMLEDDSDLTGQHNLVGSMAYLSPEQILGHAIDQRVDVYALGVLFYYMLSGSKPFVGNDTAVLYKHIHAEVPPLHERLPAGHDVPAALAALIERCLAKDPAKRPAHADDLLDELLRALAGRDVLATPWVTGEYSAAFRAMSEPSGPLSENLIFASPDTGETSNQLSRRSVAHLSSSSLSMPSHPTIDEDSEISVISQAVPRDLVDSAISSAPVPAPIPHASSSPSLTAPENRSRAAVFITAAAIFGALAAFGVMTLFVSPPEANDEVAGATSTATSSPSSSSASAQDEPAPAPTPAATDAPERLAEPADDPAPPATEPAEPAPGLDDDPTPAEVDVAERDAPAPRKTSRRTRRASKPRTKARAPSAEPADEPAEEPAADAPPAEAVEAAAAPAEPAEPKPAKTTPRRKGDDPDGIMLDAPKSKKKPKKNTKPANEFDLVDM
jgi:serine/threonine-protein kinase